MKTIGFIGGGRVTKIFLQGFENVRITFDKIVVYDTNAETLKLLQSRFPQITITSGNLQEAAKTDIIVLAIHPPVMMDVLAKIKETITDDAVLISLAPKITIEKMSAALGGFKNLARMNPSASSIVNKGVNPISFSKEMKKELRDKIMKLMQPLGSTPEVEESKIEAYAVISAMGHTYFFFQLQKIKELAINFGMDEKEAQKTIEGMLGGTTDTLFKSGLPFSEVADLVPVKPLSEVEETIKGYYDQYLTGIFNKIKP